MQKKVILSGMRPTGPLHLGHWVGALSNWKILQDQYNCFFMVADWHAFMSEYKNPGKIKEFSLDNAADWLSYGIDPDKAVIFVQSDVAEHLELNMLLSAIVPLGWLNRCPTFKEQQKQLKDRDINTYAFLGYPVLQTSDILLYNGDLVPVGADQLPHLELCREIARRFQHIYKKRVFVEPQPLLTKVPRFLGLDGRKMSKSYDNYISLSEEDEALDKKVLSMFTDPARKRKNDIGHPDVCNVFDYYKIYAPNKKDEVYKWCTKAQRGCRECKTIMAGILKEFIGPHREKKRRILKDKNYLCDILTEGAKTAKKKAAKTLEQVRQAVKL